MKSRRTLTFKKMYEKLPDDVKLLTNKTYLLWKDNHSHPSLKFKKLNSEGNTYSIRVGAHYRALGVYKSNENTIYWYWIDTHEAYNNIV